MCGLAGRLLSLAKRSRREPWSGPSLGRHMLRATYGDLCCAQNYVAYGFWRPGGHPTASVLNAPLWGRRPDWRWPSRRASNIFIGYFRHRGRSRLRLDRESLDSTNMYVEAGTELKQCVLDRIGSPNRQARPLPPRAALLAFLESLQPAQIMLRRQARSPAAAPTFDRAQHISERNIGRQGTRASYRGRTDESESPAEA